MCIVIRALISEDSGQANPCAHLHPPLWYADIYEHVQERRTCREIYQYVYKLHSVYWICTSLYASIVFNLKCHGPPIRCKLQVMWPLIELDNQCFEKCHYVKTNTAPLEWLVCGFWHVTLREILEICLYRHKLHKPLDGCDELKPFTDTID